MTLASSTPSFGFPKHPILPFKPSGAARKARALGFQGNLGHLGNPKSIRRFIQDVEGVVSEKN